MSAKTGHDSEFEVTDVALEERLLKLGSLASQAWHAIANSKRSLEMIDFLLRALMLFKSNKLMGPIRSTDDLLPLEGDVRGDDPRLFMNFPWLWSVHRFWRNISIVRIRVANVKEVLSLFGSALAAGIYCEDDGGHYRKYYEVSFIHPHKGPFAQRDQTITGIRAAGLLMRKPFLWERERMRVRFLVFTGLDGDNTFLFRPSLGQKDLSDFLKALPKE